MSVPARRQASPDEALEPRLGTGNGAGAARDALAGEPHAGGVVEAALSDPLEVFGHGLTSARLVVRTDDGEPVPMGVERWLAAATAVDERVLDRAREPVLDVGCGPGRHVVELAQRGVAAVGLDVSPVAVALARRRGAAAIRASIFDGVPSPGRWATALLLDGNVGIGGAPTALLRRVARVLRPEGQIIVELEPAGTPSGPLTVRLEAQGAVSDWFAWARVSADAIATVATHAGLEIREAWADGDRHFAVLAASPRDRRPTGR